ncbi:MAG: glycogen/starch/alpha-glucan phosphorylase [Deltaproteobacteria bacterium]|nr:glycogen/starch/alpha-glucan phosphorylase [Deltaproteobacteria bacterium]
MLKTNESPRRPRPTLWRSAEVASDVESIKRSFVRNVQAYLGRDEIAATPRDRFHALCLSVREALITRWINTQQTYYQADARRVYYISMEYLMGRALHNALVNLGLLEPFRQAMDELGYSLDELEDLEAEAGLGNGGLGRLAACFLDSLATLQIPGYGYGLRYGYGIFRQELRDGRQVEEPDDWLRLPNPWEIARPEYNVRISFGGRVQVYADERGRLRHRWVDTHDILATAYDTPIPGFRNNTVNTLRLWEARGTADFDFEDFNAGDYIRAVEHKVMAESITKVLYPNDNVYSGKELRLRQQFFLVSATLQDAIRRHLSNHGTLDNLADKVVFQLNDTHPSLAVVELMRLLLDVHGYDWEKAWEITTHSMAYTNHTLLPEALEKWPVEMIASLLPRHGQILEEVNHRFLEEVRQRFPNDPELVRHVSLFEEGTHKMVRMANLAVVGSFSVNGVAALHTELLKHRVMPEFHRIWPRKFNNKTNGVTPRRWLLSCNAPLAELITRRIGDAWPTKLDELSRLNEATNEEGFLQDLSLVKREAKVRLSNHIGRLFGLKLDPDSIFDIHVKRMHEYKRQLLNALHIIHLYLQVKRNPGYLRTPRTFLFGGKAAPGYAMAKLIIKLINDIAQRVNADPHVSQWIKVFFFPNYSVSAAEALFPAADVSQQISTAGFEASGTGNMKFALNGAVTLGTLDGANVEIAEAVGPESIFIFGHTVEEVDRLRREGYQPRRLYHENPHVAEVLDLLAGEYFNPDHPGLYQPIVESLLHSDYYLLLADFETYRQAQLRIDEAYADWTRWHRMSLRNVAQVGQFSSDRTIREYAHDIWKVHAYPIELK